MNTYLIKNGIVVNENQITYQDILIKGGRIAKIDRNISPKEKHTLIDATGKYVTPGVIDDQVHFREPGLTHKADISTESRAGLFGGVTSYFEQPNTLPQTTTIEHLEQKFSIASRKSFANYSFFLGGTNENIEQLKKINPKNCVGVKLFLGSSTGNMLVDNPQTIEHIFSNIDIIIATHCEDETTIRQNLQREHLIYGKQIPIERHPVIRSHEACYLSSSKAIELAKKTGARLHIFHLSTKQETKLFENTIPLEEKKITAEVCIHHLWFSDEDYAKKGSFIKWNPAVKSIADQNALWEALLDNRIDVIATDHAPHTLQEKQRTDYEDIPSGGPLVQHALVAMLEQVKRKKISIERVVEKMCHNPATIFQVKERGFLREGYFADIAIVDPNASWIVKPQNIEYKCKWSPFEDEIFSSRVTHTFVNGILALDNGKVISSPVGQRIEFNR